MIDDIGNRHTKLSGHTSNLEISIGKLKQNFPSRRIRILVLVRFKDNLRMHPVLFVNLKQPIQVWTLGFPKQCPLNTTL
jgi:hypothetical protein